MRQVAWYRVGKDSCKFHYIEGRRRGLGEFLSELCDRLLQAKEIKHTMRHCEIGSRAEHPILEPAKLSNPLQFPI